MKVIDRGLMAAAFPLLASMLAEEVGLKVVWQAGVPPHADRQNNRVVLPPDVDPIAALGLLIHEAGHFRFTDFDEWVKRINGDKTMHAVGNAIEDIWMEREVMRKYPGARKRLDDLLVSLQAQGLIRNGKHPVTDYFHKKLRAEYLKQPVDSALLNEATGIFLENFGEQKKDELDLLLDDIGDVDSTAKCFDLSEKIIALFAEENPDAGKGNGEGSEGKEGQSGQPGGQDNAQGIEQSQESNDQTGSSGQQSNQSEGNNSGNQQGQDSSGEGDADKQDGAGQGSGQEQNKKNQGQSSQGNEQSKSGSDANGSQGGDSGQQSQNQGNGANKGAADDFSFEGIGELVMQAIEKAQAVAGGMAGHQGEQGGGTYVALVNEGEMDDLEPEYLKGSYPKVQPPAETAQLRRGLSALLQGETLVKQRTAHCGKKVNPTKLWSTKYGGRAFKSMQSGVKRNAAVHISLDVSYSMKGTPAQVEKNAAPIQVAKKAVLSVASAIEKTAGVDVTVSTFASELKVLSKPSAIAEAVAGGGTVMAAAVKSAGMALARSIKDNKILIVVTDGAPHQPQWTRRMVEACQAFGIVVVGVGINTMAVEDLFDHHIVIKDITELPKTLLGCLRSVL
jgi:hypothetical protein